MLASTARSARPKLSLAVPTASTTASSRPTLSLAVPTASKSPLPPSRSPMPVVAARKSKTNKRVQFSEETDIKCVTPLPDECYGAFVKMGKEERRWARAAAAYE